MSEWISVEEKLPSEDGVYRVKIENYELRCCMETICVYWNGVWECWPRGFWKVTHWIDPSAEKGE